MMNERIQELIKQSGYDSRYCSEDFDPEKFAELIVRECLKFVEPDQTSGDEWCVTLDETAQSIKQHFGVRE
jgi:hypothetical protein